MSNTLQDLVDDLPTESLDMYVAHYEDGMVGGFKASGRPISDSGGWTPVMSGPEPGCRCPRASLGYAGRWTVANPRVSKPPILMALAERDLVREVSHV